MEGNIFTPKLQDIIVPSQVDPSQFAMFIVMEHVEYSLKQLMQQDISDYSEQHVVVMLYNMLCALRFLHQAGVMHRDLKPSNILFNHNCVVKLCDFGLSRVALEGNTLTKNMTTDKTLKGKKLDCGGNLSPRIQTRWYRSPEVLLQSSYNCQIDMWSLGCIVFELLKFLE